jgi:hypothetical protein
MRVEQKSTRSKWNILYAGPDLSDDFHCCARIYILGIHDVCCYYRGTATCNTKVAAKIRSHVEARVLTRSSLTVYKDTPALVKLSLYEGYRGDQMLKHVSVLHVVQGNLVPDECLQSMQRDKLGIGQCNAEHGRYLGYGKPSPHDGQNATNIVRCKSLAICGTVQVSDPEAWYDLIHVMILIIHG